ncbi:MAG: response regulator [Sandaracinaceae bacterium]|nr:response regulator [Sandaracinaceae bacterium]
MIGRILIVEDSSAMRAFVRAALEEAGVVREVVEASSGFEALRILPREAFELAIVDINMPDVNGLELIRFMRGSEAHKTTPLLVISSESSERDRERGLSLGANAYLAKPFTAEALISAVRALVPSPEGGPE